jgi:hypothetical protein
MARNYIKIDTTMNGATHAAFLRQSIGQLRTAYEMLGRCKDIMDHNHDGVVFTDIEALFGLPAGKGQNVYDMINGTLGALNGSMQNNDGRQIGERVG